MKTLKFIILLVVALFISKAGFSEVGLCVDTLTDPYLQNNGFYNLCFKASLYKEFNTYKFYYSEPKIYFQTKNNEIRYLNKTELAKRKLLINNEAFTGFFMLATPLESDVNIPLNQTTTIDIYVFQYNNGIFEKVDTFYNSTIVNDVNFYQNITVDKPVLYLYPTKTQEIKVQVQLSDHKMIYPYPTYNNGWEVIANPDGTLKNIITGKEHYCLFWETEGKPMVSNLDKGFVIKGSETALFLEEKLAQLGLNEREANEFIIYWLPQLENNPYNAIYFAGKEYESQLEISPKPDKTIHVMMLFEALQQPRTLQEQILPTVPERKGFVAVEWGGCKVECFLQ